MSSVALEKLFKVKENKPEDKYLTENLHYKMGAQSLKNEGVEQTKLTFHFIKVFVHVLQHVFRNRMGLPLYSVSKPPVRLVYISLVCNCVYCWKNSPSPRQHAFYLFTSTPPPLVPPYPAHTHLFLSFFQNIHPALSVGNVRTNVHLTGVLYCPRLSLIPC